MTTKPDTNDPTHDAEELDVEGHALPLVQGVDALARGWAKEKAGPRAAEAPLPPLTKPFPRMRDDRSR
ncbi:MAG: hypothetical protein MUE92_10200 [Chloroflexi bacterium]|jgi:hypothetical protein|nr:hypothetical protein [Chloroflexota bacterium]